MSKDIRWVHERQVAFLLVAFAVVLVTVLYDGVTAQRNPITTSPSQNSTERIDKVAEFVDTKMGIKLSYPLNWLVDRDPDEVNYTAAFKPPDGSGFLEIFVLPYNSSLEDFTNYIVETRTETKKQNLIRSDSAVLADNRAVKVAFSNFNSTPYDLNIKRDVPLISSWTVIGNELLLINYVSSDLNQTYSSPRMQRVIDTLEMTS